MTRLHPERDFTDLACHEKTGQADTAAGADVAAAPDNLPQPDPTFHGKIGNTYHDSTADKSMFNSPKAPEGAPNILLVLMEVYAGCNDYKIESTALPTGKVTLKMDFKYDGGGPGKGGTVTLSVNGKHGLLNGAALYQANAGAVNLLGIITTVFILLLVVSAAVVSLRPAWIRVAVRVAGSWVVAVGMLMFGWLYRAAA